MSDAKMYHCRFKCMRITAFWNSRLIILDNNNNNRFNDNNLNYLNYEKSLLD